MSEPRKIPAPQSNVENQRFFDAAAEGTLLIGQCDACGQPHYYPRALCPFCFAETRWVESAGKGEIYSLSTMRRGAGAPFTLAYVTLDEGPAVLTNIATDDHDSLTIGQRVRVSFVPSDGDGPLVPMFAPDGD
ncbi:OB-fold domain-containing protein [Sphingomonas bacterium]|uniref:Zn-ribbon domain-containing OB-fold protein n=1 Tax=Sphingomonas bacterium TaxID=1895847 RepID=UPI002635B855|nr:OB-fold domain-containing protein [Sphingomonas bacterium]